MITRKNPLLDTFIDVENGGEGVDTAIRKFDKEFENVIEGANATQTELDGVKEKVEALDGIDHESFALKSEIPEIVSGSGISLEINGKENKVSVNLPPASSLNPDPGLMTQNDKIILENLRNTGETFAGHVVNEDIHVPEWTAPEDIGKVLKLTQDGAEWSMGMGPGEFEGVFSVNGKQGTLVLEGEGLTEIRAEGEGKIKISTPATKEATPEKSGLMSASDKGKLNSIPNIPIPKEEDKGKALVYKEDGSLSWETQASHYIGEIFAYAGTTAPIGAVECKGQAMSKKTHPDLFDVIGYQFGGSGDTFLLPDTYSAGRFLRSRSTIVPVGEEQGDAIRDFSGKFRAVAYAGYSASGVFSTSNQTVTVNMPAGSSVGGLDYTLSPSLQVPTAEENRPVNISVMYCIQITHGYTPPSTVSMDEVVKEIEELKSTIKTHYIGEIFAYAGTMPPMGAVECRGQAMSKTVHPDLFAVIGYNFGGSGDTFYLPDTYSAGRFLRSRSGSVPVGTEQGDAIRNITGSVRSGLTSSSASGNLIEGKGAFMDSYQGISSALGYANSGTSKDMYALFDASIVVPTAEENRPVNVSVMYCIQVTHGYTNSTQVDMAALQQEVIELRNKVQYSPMFIQGFKINYVNSNAISIGEGSCRSDDNRYNIDFSGSNFLLSGLTPTHDLPTTLIYVILRQDNTVTFVQDDSPEMETAKAKRRIGAFYINSSTGIPPFDSFSKGAELHIYLRDMISNASSTGAVAKTLIGINVPAGISGEAIMRLRGYTTGGANNIWLDVQSAISPSAMEGLGGMTSSGSFFKYFTIPYLKSLSQVGRSVYFSCGGSGTFDALMQTRGHIDWRID